MYSGPLKNNWLCPLTALRTSIGAFILDDVNAVATLPPTDACHVVTLEPVSCTMLSVSNQMIFPVADQWSSLTETLTFRMSELTTLPLPRWMVAVRLRMPSPPHCPSFTANDTVFAFTSAWVKVTEPIKLLFAVPSMYNFTTSPALASVNLTETFTGAAEAASVAEMTLSLDTTSINSEPGWLYKLRWVSTVNEVDTLSKLSRKLDNSKEVPGVQVGFVPSVISQTLLLSISLAASKASAVLGLLVVNCVLSCMVGVYTPPIALTLAPTPNTLLTTLLAVTSGKSFADKFTASANDKYSLSPAEALPLLSASTTLICFTSVSTWVSTMNVWGTLK